jgi:hypothetical protein
MMVAVIYDHMVSPKGLSNGIQRHYMPHAGSKYQSVIGIKGIST